MVRGMTQPIRRVAVLGAGVMGAGIAAHCANAGIPVVLLDIVPPKGGPRNAFATGALDKLRKSKPAAFSHPRNAILIETGNFDDDLGKVADCDLAKLPDCIEASMGWYNCHLHAFRVGGREFSARPPRGMDLEWDMEEERGLTLGQIAARHRDRGTAGTPGHARHR